MGTSSPAWKPHFAEPRSVVVSPADSQHQAGPSLGPEMRVKAGATDWQGRQEHAWKTGVLVGKAKGAASAWQGCPNPPQASQVRFVQLRVDSNDTGKRKALPAFLLSFFPLARLRLAATSPPSTLSVVP